MSSRFHAERVMGEINEFETVVTAELFLKCQFLKEHKHLQLKEPNYGTALLQGGLVGPT